jgi:hypothetical protein
VVPSRRNGEYVPLHVRYDEDPALVEATPLAELLFVRCLALAGRSPSDGYLTDRQVLTVAGRKLGSEKKVKALLEELLDLGPLERVAGGVQVRAWLKWNKSSEDLGRERAKDRDRKKAARSKSEEDDPTPPPRPPRVHPDAGRNPPGHEPESERTPTGIQPESDGIPPRVDAYVGPRADARTADGTARNGTTPHQELNLNPLVASVDAREHDHSPAGELTALYAAGVPLSNHGKALVVIARALETHPPDAVRRGVGRLIAEQRTCTPDALRIAIHAGDPQPAGQQPGRRRTATEKAQAWLTVGLDDDQPHLRAITGGAS